MIATPPALDSTIDVLLFEDLNQQRLPARTLAAVLQQAGLRVQLTCFPDPDVSAVVAFAQRAQPRLIVFSILFADRVPEHLALIMALRRAGVRAHTTMVGPLPTFASAELLAACPELDSVLCGEAEASVVQLANAGAGAAGQSDEDAGRWQSVLGLVCRACAPISSLPPVGKSADGRRGHSPPAKRGELEGGDDLTFPLRDDGVPEYAGYGFATVEASRGCYHACTFCLPCAFYRAVGAPYRLRTVANLMDEIEALYRQGTRLFLFDDEQFLPPDRARDERVTTLGQELLRRGLRTAFTIKCRADDIEEALFRQLKDMGLLRVYIGIESGCQETLDLLGKRVTMQRNAEALAILEELEIVADFRSLLFHPWSTLETIRTDLSFLQRVSLRVPTCFSFHEVEVYPGTPLADRLKSEGRGSGDPWPMPYTIADARAELLRRLSRLVFGPSGAHAATRDWLTQAWYALLLQCRFESRPGASEARRLRAAAARVNGESLEMWQEMLAFVSAGDIHNADQVNELAGAWAGRVHALCTSVQDRGLG